MRTIYILSGLPGSGKTTWMNWRKMASDLHLSRDSFRDELRNFHKSTEYFPVKSKEEDKLWAAYLNQQLTYWDTLDIYIDQTTLTIKSLEKVLAAIRPSLQAVPSAVTVIYFDTPLDVCLENNRQRTGFARVSDHVIYDMAASREKPNAQITLEYCQNHGIGYQFVKWNEWELKI